MVVKPRDEWHTFWNVGETPARKVGPYGCSADMEATVALVERHGLVF